MPSLRAGPLVLRALPAAGVSFVSPEDGPVAVRDYALHMRMIAYLRRAEGEVRVTLHAGELTLGLVPREVLDDHIDQAVNVAGARRIGHGVDVAYERDAEALLRTMAARHVLVETALTSNDVILGVRGKQHPIELYLRYGVPIALVTDDEGVSRIDLTNEFVRAACARPSASAACRAFLAASPRASMEWQVERELDAFELRYAPRPPAKAGV